MIFLALIFAFPLVFGGALGEDAHEVSLFSILSNKLVENKSLPILKIVPLSSLEQRKTKGQNDEIVRQLYRPLKEFEDHSEGAAGKLEYRVLPLVSAVEANAKEPVFVVNNPFYSQNHTLNDIAPLPVIVLPRDPPIVIGKQRAQQNLTTNGHKKLFELLEALAAKYGEGLAQKVQLVALALSRRVTPTELGFGLVVEYVLNVGVAVVLPEKDGYRALGTVILNLKTKRFAHLPGSDYPDYYYDYEK